MELRSYRRAIEHLGAERPAEVSDLEWSRIQATMAMLPSAATTVLDVGCGDGRILRQIAGRFRAVGADYSCNSLKRGLERGVCATSASLPFADRSFDLVLCCEVLEHLPEPIYTRTLHELERVARRYIIVSVPYKENLRLLHTRCDECGTVFHVWGHVRRFSHKRLDTLFAGFRPAATRYVGPSTPYHNGVVLYVNQRLGGRWAEFQPTTMCPTCGGTAFRRTPRNPVTIACGLVHLVTASLIPASGKYWVLKLYSRASGG